MALTKRIKALSPPALRVLIGGRLVSFRDINVKQRLQQKRITDGSGPDSAFSGLVI